MLLKDLLKVMSRCLVSICIFASNGRPNEAYRGDSGSVPEVLLNLSVYQVCAKDFGYFVVCVSL